MLALIWGIVIVSAFWPVLAVEPVIGAGIVEIPNPIGLLPVRDPRRPRFRRKSWSRPLLPLILVASIVAIAGRYVGARDLERLQLRWLVAAFGSIAVAIPVGLPDRRSRSTLTARSRGCRRLWRSCCRRSPIGIAVTRYRLYEIDRLISRGLSWAVLSGLLLVVYATAVLLLQGLLGDVIGGQTVAVAGSTLLAAALFQPLRRRVQTAVDHRFNRARYDAERTVDRLRRAPARRGGPGLGQRGHRRVVDAALHPRTIGVWIRRPSSTNP